MYGLLIIVLLIIISFLIIKKKALKEGFGHVYTKDDFARWPGFLFPIPKDIKTVNILMKNDFQIESVSKDPPKPVKGQKFCYMTNCPPEIENKNPDQKIICWKCL